MTRAKRDLRVYLGDMLAAIARIEEYTAKGEKSFLASYLIQDAVIRQLSVIGEAAAKLPPAVRSRHPTIPWKSIVGMRNILIHDYSNIQIPRIWETVERELPVLRQAVEGLLAAERRRTRVRRRTPRPRARVRRA
jgi:uncharacterized protein with HEPN domain